MTLHERIECPQQATFKKIAEEAKNDCSAPKVPKATITLDAKLA